MESAAPVLDVPALCWSIPSSPPTSLVASGSNWKTLKFPMCLFREPPPPGPTQGHAGVARAWKTPAAPKGWSHAEQTGRMRRGQTAPATTGASLGAAGKRGAERLCHTTDAPSVIKMSRGYSVATGIIIPIQRGRPGWGSAAFPASHRPHGWPSSLPCGSTARGSAALLIHGPASLSVIYPLAE